MKKLLLVLSLFICFNFSYAKDTFKVEGRFLEYTEAWDESDLVQLNFLVKGKERIFYIKDFNKETLEKHKNETMIIQYSKFRDESDYIENIKFTDNPIDYSYKGAPKCYAYDTKKIVLQVFKDSAYNYTDIRYDENSDTYRYLDGIAHTKKEIANSKYFSWFVQQVEQIKYSKIKNIRTIMIDDKLERSMCKAELETADYSFKHIDGTIRTIAGTITPIKYGLEKTSDGNLFVELHKYE